MHTCFPPRWSLRQFYVTSTQQTEAKAMDGSTVVFKKNKKNGTTLSVAKYGGWGPAWFLARQVAGWEASD